MQVKKYSWLFSAMVAGCATVLMCSSQAFGVNPYQAANYGVNAAWGYGDGVGGKQTQVRRIAIDANGDLYLGIWLRGDFAWPSDVTLDYDGALYGGWSSGQGKIDKWGRVLWGRYTDDRYPGSSATGQSYDYPLWVGTGVAAGKIYYTGHVGHDIGTNPDQLVQGNADPDLFVVDPAGGIVINKMVGSEQLGTNPAPTWEPSTAIAVSPTTVVTGSEK